MKYETSQAVKGRVFKPSSIGKFSKVSNQTLQAVKWPSSASHSWLAGATSFHHQHHHHFPRRRRRHCFSHRHCDSHRQSHRQHKFWQDEDHHLPLPPLLHLGVQPDVGLPHCHRHLQVSLGDSVLKVRLSSHAITII